MRQPRTTRKLNVEQLEARTLMAGDVLASVVDGVLTIRGDDSANRIEITQLPGDGSRNPWNGARYEVANRYVSRNQTHTTINGQDSVILEGVKNGFDVQMGAGNDQVSVYRPNSSIVNVPGVANFDMGDGQDKLKLFGVNNHNQLNIQLGRNDYALGRNEDFLYVRANVHTMNITGDAAFQPGDPSGDDVIHLNVTAGGPVVIDTNYGDDIVRGAIKTKFSRATVDINTGSGDDNVSVDDLDYRIFGMTGPLRIHTGDGNDFVTLRNTVIESNLTVNTGRGNDFVVFSDVNVSGKFAAWLGDGNDLLESGQTNSAASVIFNGWDGTLRR